MQSNQPSRQDLENFWREEVDAAKNRYELATAEVSDLLDRQKQWPFPAPGGIHAIRDALRKQNAARVEYVRVLTIFNDLIVHGKLPSA